jgi:hypothetical protein
VEGVRDHVEHGVDLTLVGEHLGEVPHTLSGSHLTELRFEGHEDGVVVEARRRAVLGPRGDVGLRRESPACVGVPVGVVAPRRGPPG